MPGGTCDHFNSGDGACAPAAWVYLSGITAPSSQALDVMISGGVAGPRPAPRWPAGGAPAGGVCGGCANTETDAASAMKVMTRSAEHVIVFLMPTSSKLMILKQKGRGRLFQPRPNLVG